MSILLIIKACCSQCLGDDNRGICRLVVNEILGISGVADTYHILSEEFDNEFQNSLFKSGRHARTTSIERLHKHGNMRPSR